MMTKEKEQMIESTIAILGCLWALTLVGMGLFYGLMASVYILFGTIIALILFSVLFFLWFHAKRLFDLRKKTKTVKKKA